MPWAFSYCCSTAVVVYDVGDVFPVRHPPQTTLLLSKTHVLAGAAMRTCVVLFSSCLYVYAKNGRIDRIYNNFLKRQRFIFSRLAA